VPESFKVYLKVDIEVAVERAFNDEARKGTETYSTKDEAREKIEYRHREETNRWMDIYGVNRDDMSNYDLILDTTILTPDEVCNKVIDAYNNWLEN
jgi:cytidylate kinase